MTNRILFTFLAIDFLFLCSGGLILAVCFIFKDGLKVGTMPTDVAAHLLLQETPLTGTSQYHFLSWTASRRLTFFSLPFSGLDQRYTNLRYLLCFCRWSIPAEQTLPSPDPLLAYPQLCHCDASPRPRHLVLYIEDPSKFGSLVGSADTSYADSAAAKGGQDFTLAVCR